MKEKDRHSDGVGYVRIISLLLCFAVLLCCGLSVHAASGDYKTIKVGYYQAAGFQEGDGKTSFRGGYGYEYLQKIASYTGWKYEYVSGEWDDLYRQLKEGKIDLMAGISYSKKRSREILYSDYEMLKETFYIYKDSNDDSMQSGKIASYAGKKIGVVDEEKMTNSLKEWASENHADIETVTYPDLAACADAFNEHEIDGFVSADNIVSGFSGISPVEMIGKVPYYFCVAKKDQDTLKELNAALALINGQDLLYLADLKNKYSADTSISIFLSKQEKEWMNSHPEIRVGYLENYLPYSGAAEDGTADGLLKDVLEGIFEKLPGNYEPQIVYTGYKNQEDMLKALKQKKVDVVFPVGGELPYAEKNEYQQSSIVMRASVDFVYQGNYDPEKLSKIAVNKNNMLQIEFTRINYPEAELVFYDSVQECLQAVKKGEVNSTLIEALRAVKLVDEQKNMNLLPLSDTCDICFGVSYGNQDLLCILNHGLSMLGDEYGLSHAYQYMGDIVGYSMNDFIHKYTWILYILAGILVIWIVCIFAMRYRTMKKISEAEMSHNQELQEALMRARQADYAKRIFLNNISHDIRTPLNAILGMIEMNQKSADPKKHQENRQKARDCVEQLLTMMDNVIEISRLENGQIPEGKEEVDLYHIIKTTETKIGQFAEQKDIKLIHETLSEATQECPHVYGKEAYLQEILQHILENAIQYNNPGGQVYWKDDIEKISDEWIEYHARISDNGIGMKEEFLKNIFKPFTQEQYDARTTYQGSGLGLAIVKMLVDQMSGKIEISSQEGIGTTVSLKLPLKIYRENQKEEKEVPELQPSEQVKPNLKNVHILLAEDNELNIEVARFMLEEAGADVTVAKNGEEAVEIYRSSPSGTFHAILMDIMMPVMNGFEATKEIRSSGRKDSMRIPVIATTACATEEAREESLRSGINDFIEKPLEMNKLIPTLQKYL